VRRHIADVETVKGLSPRRPTITRSNKPSDRYSHPTTSTPESSTPKSAHYSET